MAKSYLKSRYRIFCKYKTLDNLKSLIKSLYYNIVPYDYRPKQIYYEIKGWFKPHWKIRPRDINWNTWVDKCDLLPSTMFEITTQFLEQECSPGIVDWDYDYPGNYLEFRGERRKVIDLMKEAVKWWQDMLTVMNTKRTKIYTKKFQKLKTKKKKMNYTNCYVIMR